ALYRRRRVQGVALDTYECAGVHHAAISAPGVARLRASHRSLRRPPQSPHMDDQQAWPSGAPAPSDSISNIRLPPGFPAVPTENPIQPSDACTYKNYPLILPIGIWNSVFLILLPLYGSLPFSPSPCTILFCASIGTDGGNPRPSPVTGNPQPHS